MELVAGRPSAFASFSLGGLLAFLQVWVWLFFAFCRFFLGGVGLVSLAWVVPVSVWLCGCGLGSAPVVPLSPWFFFLVFQQNGYFVDLVVFREFSVVCFLGGCWWCKKSHGILAMAFFLILCILYIF